ncbi:prepilin-type N-terminal cleavage/methylation domain-containing protein [Flavobacterium haoranii]|uniref:Prepilin-type N-terminal cleavage/methylation domain-containing protein n=1 Tax=Flavobacterium haoranii TaxID=683124 RepID=A0A1M6BBG2_9FLAO|nr:prepilin-type N-terminal cleavage/methylation domain-containing protein [Flavobacterium haoranii]SHI46007.1 hypothetical protein SAMN05444337_0052 [Flavobacterium haoranii]
MNKKHYIQAFSIVEVMVSLVITAIIIGIIFGIFSIVSQQLINFKEQNEYTANFNRLSYSLNKAIFESEKMQFTENGLQFQTYDGSVLVYQKQEEYLIRKASQFTDTFHLNFQEIKLDTVSNENKSKIFQKLEIHLEANKQPFTLKFYKPVYAHDIIKLQTP